MASEKPIGTLILDAGPIIKNEPSVSTLLMKSEKLVTTPAVISEIRDATTRARVESTLVPFLELKQPSPAAVRFVQGFARKTGDLAVLSRPDIEIIALAYELECQKNGGDWRLRNAPGQRRVNGSPPKPEQDSSLSEEQPTDAASSEDYAESEKQTDAHSGAPPRAPWADQALQQRWLAEKDQDQDRAHAAIREDALATPVDTATINTEEASSSIEQAVSSLGLGEENVRTRQAESGAASEPTADQPESDDAGSAQTDSDSEGWITPSNIKRHQLGPKNAQGKSSVTPKFMQVATVTTDFAMQNVLLQINLNLLSPTLQQVKHLKTFVMRCHACFQTSKDMTKQFCPRCGQPTLTRVACSTNSNGEFKLHLKKNMQWNHRGERYSIPKPTSGAANGRVKGGGKGGWGSNLILAEDQKEYTRAIDQERRERKIVDLMDADYMPAMFSGSGKRDGRGDVGRPRVGAGRAVNSRRK